MRIVLIDFCADLFICDIRKYETFFEGNLIENKSVGRIMYAMSICTKYHIFRKNIIKTITNNNFP